MAHKNVLAPIDFSEFSHVALKYAADYCIFSNDTLVIHNNAIIEGPPKATVMIDLAAKVKEFAEEDIQESVQWVKEQLKSEIKIKTVITSDNSDVSSIIETAEKEECSFIVVGSKGASGFSGAVIGSVAYNLMQKSPVPVIVVPAESSFENGGTALLAVDVHSMPNNSSLKRLFEMLNATRHRLHILFAGDQSEKKPVEEAMDKIRSYAGLTSIDFTFDPQPHPVPAIETFLTKQKTDLLILHPGHRNFFEKIMGQSVTLKMMHHTKIPIIALP